METLIASAIGVFWFFLPAGAANMAPSLFTWLPILATPIDFGKKLGKTPIFGPHKTYRGFMVAVIFAILTIYAQSALTPARDYWLVDYSNTNLLVLGFLLGFGALLGDLIKSFFKRRAKIPSGHSWVPFDQIDWIIGAIALSSFMVHFSGRQMLLAVIIFGCLHPIVNLLGYGLRIKTNKF